MKSLFLPFFAAALMAVSCSGNEVTPKYDPPMLNPSYVRFEQTPFTADVKMTWKDNSKGETGFSIWQRVDGKQQQIDLLPAESTSYDIKVPLQQGKSYSFGVRAESSDPKLCSQVIFGECTLYDFSVLPCAYFVEDYKLVTSASVTLKYKFKNTNNGEIKEYGLCWSAEHKPTVDDCFACGPKKSTATITQTISSADMEYGKTYQVCAYVDSGDWISYSEPVSVKLGDEPKGISFTWNKLDSKSEGVEVYETTTKLEGRNFHGWYAIADLSKVDCRVNLPAGRKTLEQQYTSDNIVLVNGGYFNMDSTGDISDYCCVKGEETLAKWMTLYYGVFGVDKSGVPFTGWTSRAQGDKTYFYDRPITNWKNVCSYDVCTESYPHQSSSWVPYYAVSAGPLLVQNGNVIVDATYDSESGQYITNYEDRATDIYSPGTSNPPDRTAVGYTADGKVILFICDGRIDESKGASIVELGRIMKGLGCVGALNLDGGGSTSMLLNGKRLNYVGDGNRAVRTSIGFYKK